MYLDSLGTLARLRVFDIRRREPRYVFCMPVTFQRFLRFGPVVTCGVTPDISTRGMSALVCGSPRVGETVVIVLSLSDVPIEILATVRHSTDARSEFYPLSPFAEQEIQDWIRQLKKHEESLFPSTFTSVAKFGSD